MKQKYILQLFEVGKNDLNIVGGKGANLGEMFRLGVPVPNGFIITSHAYYVFLLFNELNQKINKILDSIDINSNEDLENASYTIKDFIISSPIPEDILNDIANSYRNLSHKNNLKVAVRSSATSEDLVEESFAGLQSTFLNVSGEEDVIKNVKICWASLFEPRAIFYRKHQSIKHFDLGMAVIIEKMIEPDSSGVMFSIDPVTDNDKIVIEAIYGLGEYITQGFITPDHYEINKNSLEIIKKHIVSQEHKLIMNEAGKNIDQLVDLKISNKQKISDNLIIRLSRLAKKLENHYSYPQDIEWAFENDVLYILQTRPITRSNNRNITKLSNNLFNTEPILSGSPACSGIASGKISIINSYYELKKLNKRSILVCQSFKSDFTPFLKEIAGIIIDLGGRTCEAAVLARELGIPCIVGTGYALKILTNGQIVTIDGSTGKVYNGK